jgi:hypothetical protein
VPWGSKWPLQPRAKQELRYPVWFFARSPLAVGRVDFTEQAPGYIDPGFAVANPVLALVPVQFQSRHGSKEKSSASPASLSTQVSDVELH